MEERMRDCRRDILKRAKSIDFIGMRESPAIGTDCECPKASTSNQGN
jgi:hypothetical protein